MGLDDTHAGLPFSYRPSSARSARQPTCRAISRDELTRRGPIVVLAAASADVGIGAAGLVLATLETSYASLFTLPDNRAARPRLADGAAQAQRLAALLGENGGRQRLRCHPLHGPGSASHEDDERCASEQVIHELKRLCAETLLVAAMPVASARHAYLERVAHRVVRRRACIDCWHYAAMRQVPAGAAYLLRSSAAVRTFDVREWATQKQRLQGEYSAQSAPAVSQLPELFWQERDLSALSRIDTAFN